MLGNHHLRYKLGRQEGLTLIELLVVMLITGILLVASVSLILSVVLASDKSAQIYTQESGAIQVENFTLEQLGPETHSQLVSASPTELVFSNKDASCYQLSLQGI